MSKVSLKTTLFLFSALFAGQAFSVDQASNDEIKARIAPVGSVRLEGDMPSPAAAAPSGPRDGATVYQNSCFACHGTGAMNAPKKDDAAAWGPRLAQGMDILTKHAIEGFKAMPPKGTCMDCSDDEIKAAIDFMIADM